MLLVQEEIRVGQIHAVAAFLQPFGPDPPGGSYAAAQRMPHPVFSLTNREFLTCVGGNKVGPAPLCGTFSAALLQTFLSVACAGPIGPDPPGGSCAAAQTMPLPVFSLANREFLTCAGGNKVGPEPHSAAPFLQPSPKLSLSVACAGGNPVGPDPPGGSYSAAQRMPRPICLHLRLMHIPVPVGWRCS
ncbi:hypothetical protein DUNSADRAFT_1745 [Dunaliella salina]|uniref:Encoded protein n=1 Tax=Dunaliella salina TaxID=3046 RepID=A0ABQ7GWQ9_DUNSA|nr:hypothetical protein DUNSADRAFT_1745 [Dunaliella salina]|eukprot:KAF5839048.1 hypothetical protein DUNSADRAFT_1745 [Dunaliella salina]